MAIWLIRAGSHGEYEQKFIQENRVYVTWDALDVNLTKLAGRASPGGADFFHCKITAAIIE